MTEVCAICREDLCQNTHTLECNHTYHTNCIMNWFRTPEATKCPLCQAAPTVTYSYLDSKSYLTNLKRFSRKKFDKPSSEFKLLQKRIKKLNDLKNERKEFNKSRKEFDTQNKEIIKKYNKLRNEKWKYYRKCRQLESTIKTMQIPEYVQKIVKNNS